MSAFDKILDGSASLGELLIYAIPVVGLLLVLAAMFLSNDDERQLNKRITRVKSPNGSASAASSQSVSIRRVTRDSSIEAIDFLIKRLVPQPEKLRNRLASAGLKPALGPYLMICAGLCVVTGVGMLFVPMVPKIACLPIGLLIGFGLPHAVVGILVSRRRNKFIALFPDAIDLMVRGLKSGLPITESIKVASEEIDDPVGYEFRQVVDSLKMGTNLDEALNEMNKRLDIQEFNFLTVAMTIQAETGGNLAETLENLGEVLRMRRHLKLKIKALSSEAKASAYIIGSLPFVMAGLIYLTNPGYITKLIIDPRGHVMIAMGLCSFAVGIGTMWKMVRFEV